MTEMPQPLRQGMDHAAQFAALRQQGGHEVDAVRFQYLESLATRAQAQPDAVRRVLDARLATALATYAVRLEQARSVAKVTSPLERKAEPTPLADLLRHIAQQSAPDRADDQAELKSLRHCRDTWSQLSVDRAVKQALATGPANAGPLNSHALVLQALQTMRDIAPAYLNRFMAYADALLWLDQAHAGSTPPPKSAGRGDISKKRKSGRAKAG